VEKARASKSVFACSEHYNPNIDHHEHHWSQFPKTLYKTPNTEHTQNARPTESRPQRPARGCPLLHQSCPPAVFGAPPDRRFPANMGGRTQTHSCFPRLSTETRERSWQVELLKAHRMRLTVSQSAMSLSQSSRARSPWRRT
jgi:hypothetical protein